MVHYSDWCRGGSRRVRWGESPSERKKFLEAIVVGRGAEFGEVNRVGWHENRGSGSRDRFRGVKFKTDMCI